MPLYDYKCEACSKTFESMARMTEEVISCQCGGEAIRQISFPKIDIFKTERYEELGDDAPMISSKQHLASECQRRGLASRMLMEGYRSYSKRKEI